jgi:hypothetical protein
LGEAGLDLAALDKEGDEEVLYAADLVGAPRAFECPITCTVMRDPVIAQDSHTYERATIERWINKAAESE